MLYGADRGKHMYMYMTDTLTAETKVKLTIEDTVLFSHMPYNVHSSKY